MKPLMESILELLEEKLRRLFDPESSRIVPSKISTEPHAEVPDKPRKQS